MNNIKDLKLTNHAQQRLAERKDVDTKYNTKNLMRSSVKWYNKDDLIHDCALYRHCCYTTRKSSQIGYITDGDIEVIYNKNTHVAITVLEVKDKFKPITQFIKPEILRLREIKKERSKMKTELNDKPLYVCGDCGKEVEELNKDGICIRCKRRMQNMKARGKEYVRYLDLDENEQARIDSFIARQNKKKDEAEKRKMEASEEPIVLTVPNSESYYSAKANQTPVAVHQMKRPETALQDQFSFINILKECGCEIPDANLKEVLDVLVATDKLKDIFSVITENSNQEAMLDLERALNVVERKLQHNWEYNGFQEVDDIKFKGFLTWRRVLKGAIFFWKKLYQTNALIEIQRAWNAYTEDPNDKIVLAGDRNRMSSALRRFQITTETISTIFNTRRPFTRVFYAQSEDEAREMLVKWLGDRQLHENKSKTIVVELKSDGSEK